MNINRTLIDRALNIPSGNDNDFMMYHRLIKLIDQYNTYATDKGLPMKNIPVYDNNVNHTLMVRSMASLLKDIDRVKNIKEDEGFKPPVEDKTLTDVVFSNENKLNDGIWTYTKDNNGKVAVRLNVDAFSNSFTENSATLGYEHMPYEKLIDTDGNEYPITSYETMFTNAPSSITMLTIDKWTNRNVTNMTGMFGNCEALKSLTLEKNFYTSSVENMDGMFSRCKLLTSLSLGDKFDTAKVTNMFAMFEECYALNSLSLGDNFNTSAVTDMSYMFRRCPLTTLTLGKNFDTSNVETMNSMFEDCSALTSLSLDNFNTSKVTDMERMFSGCSALTSLSLNNFNTTNVTNMEDMFSHCSSLTSLTFGTNFNTTSVENDDNIFYRCDALTSVSLYKTSNSIIKWLQSDTWNITNDASTNVGTVTVYQGSSATWDPAEPDQWTDAPWTLSRTIQAQ